MKLRTVIFYCFMIFFCTINVLAEPDFDFLISSDLDESFEQHIPWCLDYQITSEVKQDLEIPSMDKLQDKFLRPLAEYFEPNDLVPHIKLVIGIGGGDLRYSRAEIDNYIANKEGETITWLKDLSKGLDEIYGSGPNVKYRFRLFNEVNAFRTFENPEDYYYLLSWFYPLFQTYGPDNSTLSISFAGGEGEGDDDNYANYLTSMLQNHSPTESLPFDGIDFHGGEFYSYWSRPYSVTRRIFDELFGTYGAGLFDNLRFWSLETCRTTHGLASYVWSNSISEYQSDWDVSRKVIKTACHVLNIPRMEFTAIYARRSQWTKRLGCELFDMMGILDHGSHTFDKGTRVPIYGADSLKSFTNYLSGYYPDTDPDEVFNTSNIRRYQFQSQDNKYRVFAWRDYGNYDLENQIVKVPFSQYSIIYEVDLISGNTGLIMVHSDATGYWVETTLNDNPKMFTPTLNTGSLPNSLIAPSVNSGVSNVVNFTEGTWTANLQLCNPKSDNQFIEVSAYDNNGILVGSPYERMISGNGSINLDLNTIFPAFSGFCVIESSNHIEGQIEHRLEGVNTTKGVISHLIQLEELNSELLPDQKYLSTDWEVDSGVGNILTLVNTTDESTPVTVTIFDETGLVYDSSTYNLEEMNRIVLPVLDQSSSFRYGKILIDAVPGVIGLLTRFDSSGTLWQEESLFDDSSLLSEIELKKLSIPDMPSYSRIIVSNPWPDPVTGQIIELNSNDQILNQTSITLDSDQTYEMLITNSDAVTTTLKLDNDVKVFGRKEEVITDNEGVTQTISKSVSTERSQPGKLLLSCFYVDNSSETYQDTCILIENKNAVKIEIQLVVLDSTGETVTEISQNINASSTEKICLSGIIPAEFIPLEGSLEIRIPRIGNVTAEAKYINSGSTLKTPFSTSSEFIEFH